MLLASVAQYRNFKIHFPPSPQPGKPWAFDYFTYPGSGNLTGMAFPGGEFDFYLGGVGKIELQVSTVGFRRFFFFFLIFLEPKSLTTVARNGHTAW